MERIVTIAVCAVSLSTLYYLVDPSMQATVESLSATSLGMLFIVLAAALVLGEVIRIFRFPRIVGYGLVGVMAVTLSARILPGASADTIFGNFTPLFSFAAATMGLSVGLRISTSELFGNIRETLTFALIQFLAVGGFAFVVFYALAPLPVDDPAWLLWGSIALAAIAASTGTDAVVAINGEMASSGNVPRTLIQISFVRSILVVITAIAAAAALSVEFAGGRLVASTWFGNLGMGLGVATAAGVVAGVVLIIVLRTIPNQVNTVAMTLAAAAAIFWGDEPGLMLVAALLAGVFVENTTRFGFTMAESLDRTGPMYQSIFFVFVFAALDLPEDWSSWAVALGFVAMRGVILFGASHLPRRFRIGTDDIARHLAVSMFTQASVAVFTLRLLATFEPAWAELASVMAPIILLDFALGAFLHRGAIFRATTRVEEIEFSRGPGVLSANELTTLEVGRGAVTPKAGPESLVPRPHYPRTEFRSETLNRIAERMRQRLFRIRDHFEANHFDPQFRFIESVFEDARSRLRDHAYDTFQELREIPNHTERHTRIRERRATLGDEFREMVSQFGGTDDTSRLKENLERLYDRVERACELPQTVRAPEEQRHQESQATDKNITRLRKTIHRITHTLGPHSTRVVPVRLLADFFVADGMPAAVAPAVNMAASQRLQVWQRIFGVFDDIDLMYRETLLFLDAQQKEVAEELDLDDLAARGNEDLARFDELLRQGPEAMGNEPSEGEIAPLMVDPVQPEDDRILTYWADRLAMISDDFDDAYAFVVDYDVDARRRLDLVFSEVYREFVLGLEDGGTFLLPTRRLNAAKREATAEAERERRFEDIDSWQRTSRGYLDSRAMEVQFRRLQHGARRVLYNTSDATTTELYSHLTYYPAEISERCEDVSRELRQIVQASPTPEDLKQAVALIRNGLASFIQDEAMLDVQDMRENNRFGALIQDLIAALDRQVKGGSSAFNTIDLSALWDLAETDSSRDIQVFEVPYVGLLNKHFLRSCASSYNELDLRVRQVMDALTTGLSEVNRIVCFNLDAASSELHGLEADDEDASLAVVVEFAVGGLQRAADQAGDLLDRVQTEIDAIDRAIIEETVTHLREARELLFESTPSELRQAAAALQRDHEGRNLADGQMVKAIQSRGQLLLESVRKPLEDAFANAHDQIWTDQDFDDLRDDAGRAHFRDDDADLPTSYRRLFSPSPVEIPELWVDRPEPLVAFEAAATRWRSGKRCAISITGELGVGKTSFAHRALTEHLADFATLRWNLRSRVLREDQLIEQIASLFGMRRPADTGMLITGLRDLNTSRVVLVDGLEYLLLRSIDGDSALDAFLRIVSESPRSILWVVTANSALWQFLRTSWDIEDFFTDSIMLSPLNREDCEELISRRHQVSGFRLDLPDDENADPEKYQKRWFDQLFASSQGHPTLALFYWLRAISAGKDESHLNLSTLHTLKLGHLRRLDDEKVLALAQIVIHERLDETEFMRVLRVDATDARRQLAYLESTQLVTRSSGGNYFSVNPVVYHHLCSALRERNVI